MVSLHYGDLYLQLSVVLLLLATFNFLEHGTEAASLIAMKKAPGSTRLNCAEVRIEDMCQGASSVDFEYDDGCRNCKCLLPCSKEDGVLKYRNVCADRLTTRYCANPVSPGESQFCEGLGTANINNAIAYRITRTTSDRVIQRCPNRK